MNKLLLAIFLPILLLCLFCSCGSPRFLLKETARFDTLNIQLDVKLVQQFEYRLLLEQKLKKLIDVYNTEQHPFKLTFNENKQQANCTVQFLKSKFVSRKQSNVAAGVTATGVATATYLIASNFFIPVGWVYIPNAKTTITPILSSDISDVVDFPKVTLASTGMYRKQEKQQELQSTKVVRYILAIVQNLEKEYTTNISK